MDFSAVEILPRLMIYPGGCEYNGKSARLSPQQNTFLTTLRDNEVATFNQLIGAIYAGCEWPMCDVSKVYACHLRKKLRPMGIGIENVWGLGYRLNYGT